MFGGVTNGGVIVLGRSTSLGIITAAKGSRSQAVMIPGDIYIPHVKPLFSVGNMTYVQANPRAVASARCKADDLELAADAGAANTGEGPGAVLQLVWH